MRSIDDTPRKQSPACVNCETYLMVYQPYAPDKNEMNRFLAIAGWRPIEINGGELTDDWHCPACYSRLELLWASTKRNKA